MDKTITNNPGIDIPSLSFINIYNWRDSPLFKSSLAEEILWYSDTEIILYSDIQILWYWDTEILRYYDNPSLILYYQSDIHTLMINGIR